MAQFTFRTPVAGDAEALGETVAQGFAGYRAFTPQDWEPPGTDKATTRLTDPTSWWLLAETAGRPAGHVAFMPAALHPEPDPDPLLAHLGALFLRVPFHGSGLAAELLRRAEAEAMRRGFRRGRLFTPAGAARARRFYDRERWTVAGESFVAPHLGLEIVEYRLTCG